jgi:DNA-binding transcriptional LysR family regulator
MELRHLRYFVAAAEAENVSRAALQLHVSQPALSRQIHDLEEELRFPLFHRSAKSIRLTAAGRVFLSEAKAALERVDQAVVTARAIATGGRGELAVGYAPSPTVRVLPPTLRAFQAQMPGVRVRLHDLSTEELLTGVRRGDLQLALVVRPSRALLRGLQFEALAQDEVCLAVPPGHRWAGLPCVTVAQLVHEPLLAFSQKDYPEYHDLIKALFAPAKAAPKIAEEHDSAASLIAAVESGAGLAIVPRSFSCSAGLRLKLVALSPSPAPLVIGAIWLKDGLAPAARLFVNVARQAAKELAPLKG